MHICADEVAAALMLLSGIKTVWTRFRTWRAARRAREEKTRAKSA